MKIAHAKTVVVGMGVTGIALARFLSRRGASVTLTDTASEQELAARLPKAMETGVSLELGGHNVKTFMRADLIVLSPGVPHTILPVQQAREKGIEVMGEIELASRFIREPIIGITGTNGKTTTTMLVGEILRDSGFTVFVGGNIGTPLVDYVDAGKKADIVVAEISSFQLDTTDTFRPHVGVLLNVTEDHLDRYPDFAGYLGSKASIFKNLQKGDIAVFNAADPNIRGVCENLPCRKLPFFEEATAAGFENIGAAIGSRRIRLNLGACIEVVVEPTEIHLSGRHNMENIAAAGLAALAVGGSASGLRKTLARFTGLAHRLQPAGEINGVSYINDSKATNMDATLKALASFDRPVMLILGGRNKGGDFSQLSEPVRRRVKRIFAVGEATQEIKKALSHAAPVTPVASIEDAVRQSGRWALPGDAVLLSPACASFDMFKSYAERGALFCKAVNGLKRKNS